MAPPATFRLPDLESQSSPVFITPEHQSFSACMRTSFVGFVHEPSSALPASFHRRFRHCLSGLNADGVLARYDITQPMGPGTALARTRVTRCLIGKPGSTYKYLGLRMFAHPWSGDEASEACKELRKLSKKLEDRAVTQGGARDGTSCFNLVLLNRMAPEELRAAKREKVYGMGPLSVAWHADSSLQDFTAISVYVAHHPASQRTFDSPAPAPQPSGAPERAWRVALRVVHDVEGPTMRATLTAGGEGKREESKRDDDVTPAVLIPMSDGDCYHMVDDFNHHHQHAVIQPEPSAAADTYATEAAEAASALEVRYSSTHRVALEDGHSFSSVRQRCVAAVAAAGVPLDAQDDADAQAGAAGATGASSAAAASAPSAASSATASAWSAARIGSCAQWQEEQACLSELEFEWIRQWYVQGAAHRDEHGWWGPRIAKLEALWSQLERLTFQRLCSLRLAVAAADGAPDGVASQGSASQCMVPQGSASQGMVPQGSAPQGAAGIVPVQARAALLTSGQATAPTTAPPTGTELAHLLELGTVLKGALTRRHRLRAAWAQRVRDPIFTDLPVGYSPLPCLFEVGSPQHPAALGELTLPELKSPELKSTELTLPELKSPELKSPELTLPEDLGPALVELERLQARLSAHRKLRKPCYQFAKFGNCSKGGACPFAHERPAAAAGVAGAPAGALTTQSAVPSVVPSVVPSGTAASAPPATALCRAPPAAKDC